MRINILYMYPYGPCNSICILMALATVGGELFWKILSWDRIMMYATCLKSKLFNCRRNATCRFLVLSLIMIFSACTPAREHMVYKPKESSQLDALLQLNDLNERAFAYHQYCLNKTEPMNEVFLENFKLVANMLFDEALDTWGEPPEYTVSQILKRREDIQHTLDKLYMTKGCQFSEAWTARKHYRTFSQLNEEQVKKFKIP